jgi:GT2 family glycosyltransferase
MRLRIGETTFEGVYGDLRTDVQTAFPEAPVPDGCGYEIPVALTCPIASCELQAQTDDGAWHRVGSLTLAAPPARSSAQADRWRRFWNGAKAGNAAVWAGLTWPERDFAVARMRQRGWHNLFVGPHHAPRALQPDRLPSVAQGAVLPRLTVVTPSFQQGAFLEDTIRSVLGQEGVDLNYIVQDGGSSDGSVEIIRRHQDRLVHWESGPDNGQAAAVVRGFSRAPGGPDDLMMYLNADDVLMPDAARFVAEHFAAHPEVDVVYGHRVLINEVGREIGRWLTPRPACDDLRLHNLVPQETLFWRRRIWDRVGGLDPSLQFALDWDLLLRFQAADASIARLPWFLAAFRVHDVQKTRTRWETDAVPEIHRLRRRTLGRDATSDELHLAMARAQVDSAFLHVLLKRGRRV